MPLGWRRHPLRLRNLLLLAGITILGIAASGGALMVGWQWYQGLVLPREVKPPAGSLSWSPPPGTVPTGETEPPMTRREADGLLRNPEPATPESIARGRKMFETYCVLCHGDAGRGDGPVSEKFLKPPDLPSILGRRTDGYLLDRGIRAGIQATLDRSPLIALGDRTASADPGGHYSNRAVVAPPRTRLAQGRREPSSEEHNRRR